MYCLPLVIAFCLAQTEGLSNQLPSITSRATVLPPDYTEAVPPKKLLQKYRRSRSILLGSNDGGGGDRKAGTESLEDSFDHKMFRRRNKDDEWNWDTYCQLQPQYGSNCQKPQKKYYYDRQLDSCLPFQYTGCKKNKNNFNNLWECEGYCKGAAYSDVVRTNLDAKIICALQTDAGRCLAYFKSYYFDINTGTCKKFGYGGCGGNENQFKIQSVCNKICKHTLREEAEVDEDSGETDLSSDYHEPEKKEVSTTLSAVKRSKKKKHRGYKSGLNKSEAMGDISKSNEGFMAKSKQGASKGKVRFSEQSNTMKNNKDDNAQKKHERFVTTKSSGVKIGKGKNTAKSRNREALDRTIKESEVTKTTPENYGDSKSVNTFSAGRENIGKHNKVDNAQNNHERFVTTKSSGVKIGKGKDTAKSRNREALDRTEDVTGKSRSKEALDRIVKDVEATKTTPENDGDSMSVITFSASRENIGKHNKVDNAQNNHERFVTTKSSGVKIGKGKDTAKSRYIEALDRTLKESEATKTTPENDGDSMSVNTFSGSGENMGKHEDVTAKSRSKEALDRIVKDFEATKTTPANDSNSMSVITFSGSVENTGKHKDATAKSRSKEALDRIIKDFEATKTPPANVSDEMSVITFNAAQTDLGKNNENTAANAISGSNEVLDKQDADPKSVIIHSHSAEIISGNPNITISIEEDLDESSSMSVLYATDIQI